MTPAVDPDQKRVQISFSAAELLEFAPPDTRTLFDLRNQPSVRAFMPNTEPLVYASHLNWVTQHLFRGGPLRIFIVRHAGRPIGFTVLKHVDASCCEIGVVMAESSLHPGLAAQVAALMLHLSFIHFDATLVMTYVNAKHARAIALNRGLGDEVPSTKPNELSFIAPREKLLNNPRYQKIMARLQRTMRMSHVAWP